MMELLILHVYPSHKPDVSSFEDCLSPYLQGINFSFHYEQNINVAEGITQFTLNMKAGLLALINRHDGFLQQLFRHSVTAMINQRAEIPLLVIHE